MPRFEHNPSAVTTSIEVFPKDTYEFTIGTPKPFFGQNAKQQDSYGVRIPLTIATGPYQGKRTLISLYFQSEGAQSMAKQFQMAALGYSRGRAEEQKFDAEWGAKDWSFDTDSGSVGDAWGELVGGRIVGDLDVGINTNTGDEQQQFKAWRPLGK